MHRAHQSPYRQMLVTMLWMIPLTLVAMGITAYVIVGAAIAGLPNPDANRTGAVGLLVLLVAGLTWYAKACSLRMAVDAARRGE